MNDWKRCLDSINDDVINNYVIFSKYEKKNYNELLT